MSIIIIEFIQSFCEFILVSLPFTILGMVILPIILLFYDIGKFPRVVRWFDIVDPYIGRDTTGIETINKQGYWAKYVYTAWRNPINYFSYKVLGLYFEKIAFPTYEYGDPQVGDTSKAGLYHVEYDYYWYEVYFVYQYPFAKSKCLRIRFGWKLGPKVLAKQYVENVFVVSPWHSYTGKSLD